MANSIVHKHIESCRRLPVASHKARIKPSVKSFIATPLRGKTEQVPPYPSTLAQDWQALAVTVVSFVQFRVEFSSVPRCQVGSTIRKWSVDVYPISVSLLLPYASFRVRVGGNWVALERVASPPLSDCSDRRAFRVAHLCHHRHQHSCLPSSSSSASSMKEIASVR